MKIKSLEEMRLDAVRRRCSACFEPRPVIKSKNVFHADMGTKDVSHVVMEAAREVIDSHHAELQALAFK